MWSPNGCSLAQLGGQGGQSHRGGSQRRPVVASNDLCPDDFGEYRCETHLYPIPCSSVEFRLFVKRYDRVGARRLNGRQLRHDDRLDAVTRCTEAGGTAARAARDHSGHAGHSRSARGLRRGAGQADGLKRRGGGAHHRGDRRRPNWAAPTSCRPGCPRPCPRCRHRAEAAHAAMPTPTGVVSSWRVLRAAPASPMVSLPAGSRPPPAIPRQSEAAEAQFPPPMFR